MEEKQKLTFRAIETSDVVYLYFSDGNVLSVDAKGIIAYSSSKTVEFDGKETQVHSTYISAKDGEVTVWIMPCKDSSILGLQNDVRLAEAEKTIRTYNIPQKHYDMLKTFIWQQTVNQAWPDD